MTMQTFPNGYLDEPESSKHTGTDAWHARVTVREAVREYVGDGDGADAALLDEYDRGVAAWALEQEARSDKYDRPCEDRLLDRAEEYRRGGS